MGNVNRIEKPYHRRPKTHRKKNLEEKLQIFEVTCDYIPWEKLSDVLRIRTIELD